MRSNQTQLRLVNLNLDDRPLDMYERQMLYVLESKNYVDKTHVDMKMRQMLILRNEVLRELQRLKADRQKLAWLEPLPKLSKKQKKAQPVQLTEMVSDEEKAFRAKYKQAWVQMVRHNKYLLKLHMDRIRLFFSALFIHPGVKRYIEAIHAGLDRWGYEQLAFAMASATDDFARLTHAMSRRALSDLTFDSLRALAHPGSHLHQILAPYDELRPALDYFKGHIGYLDDRSDYGIRI